MIRQKTTKSSSRFSETPNAPVLIEISRTMHFDENYPIAPFDVTWTVRYTILDARRGKISAQAFFTSTAEWDENDSCSSVESGGVWSSKEREKLVDAFMESTSLGRTDHAPRPNLTGLLEDIGVALLESCAT